MNRKLIADVLTMRNRIASYLGMSFGGKRDLYTSCGYPVTLDFERMLARYKRQDIASRVVNAFPDACFRVRPTIYETEESSLTPFEAKWEILCRDLNVFSCLKEADRLAGIGRFGVLLIGYNDGKELSEQVSPKKEMEVLYLQSYTEGNVTIDRVNNDPMSSSYGMPSMYKITDDNRSFLVHPSRVLHIAESRIESRIYGTPRMEKVYNRLQELETILAGSAEMFWQGGFPGIAFEADPEVDIEQSKEELKGEIDNYIHGFQRNLNLQGIKANVLTSSIANPVGHVSIIMDMISGGTGIPKRILTGSEVGQLASGQDRENWLDRVDERRRDHVEPNIIRPFMNALIRNGVLPQPKEIIIYWDDVSALGEKEKAVIAQIKTNTIVAYVNANGADGVLPQKRFLTDILGYNMEEADAIVKEVDLAMEDTIKKIDMEENEPPAETEPISEDENKTI
jgi:phage-related protein (TIGR01555 family)